MSVRRGEVAQIVDCDDAGAWMDERDDVRWHEQRRRPVAQHGAREANMGPKPPGADQAMFDCVTVQFRRRRDAMVEGNRRSLRQSDEGAYDFP